LAAELGELGDREVMIAPPFTGLHQATKAAQGTMISVAAQDVFWEAEGAYTGEVSTRMLADLGVRAAIIGHSERRQWFGETDESVAKKVRAVLSEDLVAIVCVGEDEQEREDGLTETVLGRQVAGGLSEVRPEDAVNLAIAYEPVWAIGTGNTATPEAAQSAIAYVRGEVGRALGDRSAEEVRILYGGSVGPQNIDALMDEPDIDGVLVGGASLQVAKFVRIVKYERS
jgi:triosephosphate isomerase